MMRGLAMDYLPEISDPDLWHVSWCSVPVPHLDIPVDELFVQSYLRRGMAPLSPDEEVFSIWTDASWGGCLGFPAGLASMLFNREGLLLAFNLCPLTVKVSGMSHEMERLAVLMGMSMAPSRHRSVILSDSLGVVNGFRQETSLPEKMRFLWVKGHSNHYQNALCDVLARAARVPIRDGETFSRRLLSVTISGKDASTLMSGMPVMTRIDPENFNKTFIPYDASPDSLWDIAEWRDRFHKDEREEISSGSTVMALSEDEVSLAQDVVDRVISKRTKALADSFASSKSFRFEWLRSVCYSVSPRMEVPWRQILAADVERLTVQTAFSYGHGDDGIVVTLSRDGWDDNATPSLKLIKSYVAFYGCEAVGEREDATGLHFMTFSGGELICAGTVTTPSGGTLPRFAFLNALEEMSIEQFGLEREGASARRLRKPVSVTPRQGAVSSNPYWDEVAIHLQKKADWQPVVEEPGELLTFSGDLDEEEDVSNIGFHAIPQQAETIRMVA